MQIGRRLRQARKAAGLTQRYVANKFGIKPQSVSGWERDESQPEPDKLAILARMLGTSTDWLLKGSEADLSSEDVASSLDRPPARKIKVKGYVGAGGETILYNVAQGDFDEIDATNQDGPQAVAARIVGSSMGRLLGGWYVVYEDVRRPVTDDLVNKLCVVGLRDGRVLVKKIERYGNKFKLVANVESEDPILDADIEWAAKVTALREAQ